MTIVAKALAKIQTGGQIDKAEALRLYNEADLAELCAAADDLRAEFCGTGFDLCSIINGKCGKCSEDCKYCAQSAHYPNPNLETYPMLSTEEILAEAKINEAAGVLRYSIVTSGRRLSKAEVARLAETIRVLRAETGLEICISLGLLDEEDFRLLHEAGASRVHCNLETSARYFPEVCTTHSYDEKIQALKAAKQAGLALCSGGILGLGETPEDRIDMVLTARELGVRSIPVNLLNAISGTPFADNPRVTPDEARRSVAVFRFLIPDGAIRLAGGRGLLDDKGVGCFQSGANAAITGDMLTTAGITVERDLQLLDKLGYQPQLLD